MDQEIKRISDPGQLHQIAEKVFSKLPVQLLDKSGTYPVKVNRYAENCLYIVHNQPEAPTRFLTINQGDNKMFLECLVEGRSPEGEEIVRPTRLHLKRQVRAEARVSVQAAENRVAWITDLITLKTIPDSLSAFNNQRDQLINAYQEELKRLYGGAEILFRKTFRMDVRMRVMSNLKRPIFVPSRMNPASIDATRFVTYEEYRKIIQYDHLADTVVAEVTEPLIYKGLYMYGYIRVYSDRDLGMDEYEKVAQVARDFEMEFISHDFLPVNPEKSVVVDINLSGVGFMHPHNPAVIRNFMPGEHIIFNLNFPGNKIVPFTAIIRNMKSFEKAHRIGVEFENLTLEQKDALMTFIGTVTGHAPVPTPSPAEKNSGANPAGGSGSG